MFCRYCGFKNADRLDLCQFCDSPLIKATPEAGQAVYVDIRPFGLRRIIIPVFKLNLLVGVLSTPFIILNYLFCLLTNKPYRTCVFTNRFSQKMVITDDAKSLWKHHDTQKILQYLQEQGFSKVIDYEDTSQINATAIRLMIHQSRKQALHIVLTKMNKKIAHLDFFGVTVSGRIISVDNADTIDVPISENDINLHFNNKPVHDLYSLYKQTVQKNNEQLREHNEKELLIASNTIRNRVINSGIKSGLLLIKGTVKPPILLCQNHPRNIAIRTCEKCGKSICELCIEHSGGYWYCKSCAPEKSSQKIDSQPKVEEQIAGIIPRLAALMANTLFIAAGAIIFMLLNFVLHRFIENQLILRLGIFSLQLGFIIYALFYLYILPVRLHGTIGHRIFGLFIYDNQGNPAGKKDIFIRFAYFVLSCFFIFPFIGYPIAIFNKRRQGLAARLSDTVTVVKKSVPRKIAAWTVSVILFLTLIGGLVLAVLGYMKFFSSDTEPIVLLEEKWTFTSEENQTYYHSLIYNDSVYISIGPNLLTGIEIRTGKVLWISDTIPSPMSATNKGTMKSELSEIIVFSIKLKNTNLYRIDPLNGNTIWKQSLDESATSLYNDSLIAVLMSRNNLWTFDCKTGNLLWKKELPFRDHRYIRVMLNRGVLLHIFKNSKNYITRYDMSNGTLIWQDSTSGLYPIYGLGNGFHIFQKNGNTCALFNLIEKETMWQIENATPWISGHYLDSNSDLKSLIYFNTHAVHFSTGDTAFTLPSPASTAAITQNFIISYSSTNQFENNKSEMNIFILDKFDGTITRQYSYDFNGQLSSPQERNGYLSFAIQGYIDSTFITDVDTIQGYPILYTIINKENFKKSTKLIGFNVSIRGMVYCAIDSILFIQNRDFIGGYNFQ